MVVQESEKATRYIGLLNEARLNGSWNDVPELVRKVDKHAPHRKCLTITAAAEAQTAASSSRRPATSSSTISHTSLLDVTPNLVQAIDQEQTYFEDAFQANVTLHEIYFLRAEWSAVAGGLDHDVWQQVARYSKSPADISPNTRLAIVKSRYFLGVALEQTASLAKALLAYNQALPAIEQAPIALASSHEYRVWAARLSGRICTLHSNQGSLSTLAGACSTLVSFRAWARISNHDPSRSSLSPSYGLGSHDVSNRDVWSLYYHFLSSVLASDLVYTPSAHAPLALYSPNTPAPDLARLRLRQRNELKDVETAYESLLLNGTRFPQASQSNSEVEQWTQQVVSNWSVLCGPKWRDIDLGEGGKAGVGRSVLDILYRAATKTFHSTPILRHLFNVHASLAEFDLAISAFDSYSEIVGRAKSRADKTGHGEADLDSDDLVVLTAAQAIGVLCRYGSQPEADKAIDIAKKLSNWISLKQRPTSSSTFATVEGNTHANSEDETASGALVARSSLIAAHRAIGESQANWARLTHDPPRRSEYRTKAIKSLQKASDMSGGVSDPETALLLATVLAENRELQPAVQVVKQALAASAQETDEDSEADIMSQRRLLMPLYHLMSLLLTARGEHENAVKFCNAAFEQFGGADILFGDSDDGVQTMNQTEAMEDSEREGLLQLRLTQIALTELIDGPEVSVDASIELVALYNKLFGVKSIDKALPQKESALVIPSAAPALAPPTKPAGALKSISGSIMSKSRGARKNPVQENGAQTATDGATNPVQVTNQEGVSTEKHHHVHLPHHPLKHLGHHHTNDPEKEAAAQEQAPPVPSKDGMSNTDGQDFAPSQPLPTIAHNVDHSKQPAPIGHNDQVPSQDIRLPAPHPAIAAAPRPRYPSAQQKRHTVSLLVEVWLYIAGQYTRVEMFEDTEGAIDEAHKLVDSFQQAIAKEESSARAFDERGWGAGKSINRLWADIWSERADLALARFEPHEALVAYERALSHYPDHPAAIVGISSILLDIYEEKTPIEAPSDTMIATNAATITTTKSTDKTTPSPATLTRLAARDRAYMLLSTLTTSGEGWDDSEAWSMLARAHELSGQVDGARECLWFLVELEDGRPVRPWHVVDSAF